MQNFGLKYGIIAGVGVVAYLLLFYFISPRLMLHSGILWSTLIIYVIGMYRATVRTGGQQEAFPFRAAIKPPFTVYILATLFYYIFYYLMFNVIDPSLVDIQYELMMENARKMGEMMGGADFEQQIQKISPEEMRVTVKNTLLGMSWSLIGGFILSVIMAAGLRKE